MRMSKREGIIRNAGFEIERSTSCTNHPFVHSSNGGLNHTNYHIRQTSNDSVLSPCAHTHPYWDSDGTVNNLYGDTRTAISQQNLSGTNIIQDNHDIDLLIPTLTLDELNVDEVNEELMELENNVEHFI